MSAKMSGYLHGNVKDKSPVAILVVDVINDFNFKDGTSLARKFLPAAANLSRLVARARQKAVPVIFVNDNFGRWHSDLNSQVQHCLKAAAPRRSIVALLKPQASDYFVLKPKHSGFYASPLHLLLQHMEVKRLVLAGIATESCVFFTAIDAFIRGYQLTVAADCVASVQNRAKLQALAQMKNLCGAQIVKAAAIRLPRKTGRRAK